MACRVNYMNKKNGITYVYESISYWDKEKNQARNKRVCVGKLDSSSGAFIPSKRLNPNQAAASDPVVTVSATIVGPSLILDALTESLKLDTLLASCFPQHHKQIQAMAYYLAVQGGALSHCAMEQKPCP